MVLTGRYYNARTHGYYHVFFCKMQTTTTSLAIIVPLGTNIFFSGHHPPKHFCIVYSTLGTKIFLWKPPPKNILYYRTQILNFFVGIHHLLNLHFFVIVPRYYNLSSLCTTPAYFCNIEHYIIYTTYYGWIPPHQTYFFVL